MNLPYYFAQRILKSSLKGETSSRPVTRLATIGIILGVSAMILSVTIVTGFQKEISNKVTGFMSHIKISGFNMNNSFEEDPISTTQINIKKLQSIEGVKHIQPYAYKAGILKSKSDIQGVVLKGVDSTYDWSFLKDKIVEGKLPQFDSSSTEVLISKSISKKLDLKVHDSFLLFFIQEDKKVRKMTISGIYNTGLSEDFDNLYVIGDLKLIQKINNWKADEVGGYEVIINDFNKLNTVSENIYNQIGYKYNTQTVVEEYPQIFNWLELQNLNVIVIITLITLVAGITMISTLFILVIENSKQIGLLKAMGSPDLLIRKTFLYVSFSILSKGILVGNIIGIGLAYLQHHYKLIKLEESSYYITSVPVNFTVSGIIIINISTIVICVLMMIIPSNAVSKINPIKVLQVE